MTDPTKNRHEFIGGSDISAVMGLSRWETPLSIWALKTQKITKDLSDVEAVEMGIDLEPFVAKKFEQRSGKKVRIDTRDFTHPDYSYMRYHVDRWVINEDGKTLEAKTCSAWKAQEWEGQEIPDEYFLQNNWGYGIMALHRGVKPVGGYIAVLIGGQRFVWKECEFSQELFDKQVAAAKDFWENYVLADVAPMAISNDKDTLTELFPESRGEIVKVDGGDLESQINHLAIDSIEGKAQVKDIYVDIDKAENELRQLIGDDQGIETGMFKATWKTQGKTSIDTEKLKADGLYDKYKKVGTSRVLRIVEKKGKK